MVRKETARLLKVNNKPVTNDNCWQYTNNLSRHKTRYLNYVSFEGFTAAVQMVLFSRDAMHAWVNGYWYSEGMCCLQLHICTLWCHMVTFFGETLMWHTMSSRCRRQLLESSLINLKGILAEIFLMIYRYKHSHLSTYIH